MGSRVEQGVEWCGVNASAYITEPNKYMLFFFAFFSESDVSGGLE